MELWRPTYHTINLSSSHTTHLLLHPLYATKKNQLTVKYDFNNSNLKKLRNALTTKVSTITEDNYTFEQFICMLNKCIDDSCKLNIPTHSKRNKLNNPWITKGVMNSISKRDRLYKKWRATRTKLCTSGSPRLYEEYRKYRNMLSNLIKKAKQSYYTRKFENAAGDLKKTWSAINELRGKTKTSSPKYLKVDNCIITDKKTIANKFNKYFCSLAEKLNNSVDQTVNSRFTHYLGAFEQSSIFLEDSTSNLD